MGIHVTMPIVAPPAKLDRQHLSEAERVAVAARKHFDRWDSGYARQQSTRPQTLGYGLTDSPVGQAAWIVEKFWAWTDCGGGLEEAVTRDELLDNITLYWVTASAASSARLYWESFPSRLPPVRVPAGVASFPADILRTPRWAQATIRTWSTGRTCRREVISPPSSSLTCSSVTSAPSSGSSALDVGSSGGTGRGTARTGSGTRSQEENG